MFGLPLPWAIKLRNGDGLNVTRQSTKVQGKIYKVQMYRGKSSMGFPPKMTAKEQ